MENELSFSTIDENLFSVEFDGKRTFVFDEFPKIYFLWSLMENKLSFSTIDENLFSVEFDGKQTFVFDDRRKSIFCGV